MSTQERLEALEVKAAFTEDLLDQLYLTIYRQQQQIVELLRAVTELRCDAHHLGNAPAAEVRHPPVADLAGLHQIAHRTQRLFQVHAVDVAVHVADVDVVGLQAGQAGIDFAQDPAA